MPSKTSKKQAVGALPRIAREFIDQMVSGPMSAEAALMIVLDDGTEVIFRKDFGEQAHPVGGLFQGKGAIDPTTLRFKFQRLTVVV
jgi:hypothetical protein